VISKKRFVSKLREIGYEFKEQLHFQERFRKAGGTHVIHVPRRGTLTEEYVCSTLKQAGQSKSEIDKFLREARA
jgi:hypothetical protein